MPFVGGTSSFLTISEHFKRKWKETAGCDLGGMKFDGVSFRGAILVGAKLDGSSFVGCDFSNVDLTDCSARNCDFQGVRFSGSQIVRTAFSGSNLQNTVFIQAHAIKGSTNKDARMRFNLREDPTLHTIDSSAETRRTLVKSANFGGCDLRGAVFWPPPIEVKESTTTEANWIGADRLVPLYVRQTFSHCQIHESSFSKSNLHGLDLHSLNLKGCNFGGAHLQGVNLEWADIQNLNLSACNLVNANLHHVKYNSGTQFPEGYPIPSDAEEMGKEIREKESREELKKRINELAKHLDQTVSSGGPDWLFVLVFAVFVVITAAVIIFGDSAGK